MIGLRINEWISSAVDWALKSTCAEPGCRDDTAHARTTDTDDSTTHCQDHQGARPAPWLRLTPEGVLLFNNEYEISREDAALMAPVLAEFGKGRE